MRDWLIYHGLWPGTSRAAFQAHKEELRTDRDAWMEKVYRDTSLSVSERQAKAEAIYDVYKDIVPFKAPLRERAVTWLGQIAGGGFALFLMVGLPVWIWLDGVGAGCVNDPGGEDPHCHAAIPPHDWAALVLFGGIWWIGVIAAVVGWTWRKMRRKPKEGS